MNFFKVCSRTAGNDLVLRQFTRHFGKGCYQRLKPGFAGLAGKALCRWRARKATPAAHTARERCRGGRRERGACNAGRKLTPA